jgi:TDG/mug DNA glycosylase family protein
MKNESYPFRTLPDYLAPHLDIVFIGINPGLYSVEKGHYFARKTSRFWPAFSTSKISAEMRAALGVQKLSPENDVDLTRFGFGFTDVIKRPSANASELLPSEFMEWAPRLVEKLKRIKPQIACFHGLTAYRPFLKFGLSGTSSPSLGPQPELLGETRLFVVPNPSPANAHFTVHDQAAWYDRLADFLDGDGRSVKLDWKNECLAQGLRCYRGMEFFAAHEHWEVVWLQLRGREKLFLQALIQMTAAFHHWQNGNLEGTASLLRAALRKLENYGERFGGVQVGSLREDIRKWLSTLKTRSGHKPLPFPRVEICTL